MNQIVETHISNQIFRNDRAYIYIWFSKIHKIIYVGMTNNRIGTLGRAAQHLDKKGTFRTRFEQNLGYSINRADDLILFSFILPPQREFTTVESSYREAIEYLVQKKLTVLKGKLKYTYDIVSWVRSNDRISNRLVRQTSEDIVNGFALVINHMN